MTDQDREKEKDLLGHARVVRPSMRGRGASPPKRVKATSLSLQERIRTARGLPQAVAKITRFHRNATQCRRHWTYISRRATLELETEKGELLKTLDEQKDVLAAWELFFDPGPRSRNQMNYMVSAPKGSSPETVHNAAREFGKVAFADHQYVFVLHTDKAHPHVHFAVHMQGQGKKLNPRLKDLHRWRELWAETARKHGIEMACSPRSARGVGRRRPSSPIYHLQQRGIVTERTKRAAKETALSGADTAWEQYLSARNTAERQAYRQSAVQLRTAAKGCVPAERAKLEAAATELEQFAARMPAAKTRRQQMREALAKHQQQKSSIDKEHEDHER